MSESHTCPDEAAFIADMRHMFDELDPETIRKYTSDVLRDMIETLRLHQVRGARACLCRVAQLACAPRRPAPPPPHPPTPTPQPTENPGHDPQVTLKSTVSTVVVTTLVLEGWSSKLNPDLKILDSMKDILATDWSDRMGRAVDKIMATGTLAVM
jgi:aarF domain-containing kinase